MMVRFGRKQKETPGRVPQVSSRTAPVMRYYRPPTKAASRNAESRRGLPNEDKSTATLLPGIKKFLVLFSQWAAVIAIVLLLLANTTLSGVSVRVKGSEYPYRENEQYSAKIYSIMKQNILYRTKFLTSSTKLETEIKQSFPEVESAVVVIPLAGTKLQVTLDVAAPLVRLMRSGNELAVISSAGVVTQTGSSDEINATFSSLPSLSVVGAQVTVGQQLLTQEEIDLLRLLILEFDGSSAARPTFVSAEYDIQKREIKARFKDKSYYAKLTPEREVRVQVGSLVTALKALSDQAQQIAPPSEYIDVRVDDRLFMR